MKKKDRSDKTLVTGAAEVDPNIEGVEQYGAGEDTHPSVDLSAGAPEPVNEAATTQRVNAPTVTDDAGGTTADNADADTAEQPTEDLAPAGKPFLSGPAKVIGGALLGLLIAALVIGYLAVRAQPGQVGKVGISPVPTSLPGDPAGIPAGTPGAALKLRAVEGVNGMACDPAQVITTVGVDPVTKKSFIKHVAPANCATITYVDADAPAK